MPALSCYPRCKSQGPFLTTILFGCLLRMPINFDGEVSLLLLRLRQHNFHLNVLSLQILNGQSLSIQVDLDVFFLICRILRFHGRTPSDRLSSQAHAKITLQQRSVSDQAARQCVQRGLARRRCITALERHVACTPLPVSFIVPCCIFACPDRCCACDVVLRENSLRSQTVKMVSDFIV